MKVLFDTSVLIAGSMQLHSDHQRALVWMEKARNGQIEAVVSAHTLAEVYSVMTRIPVPQQVSPSNALRIIERNIVGLMQIIALTGDEYIDLIRHLSQTGIAGGATYDAVIACAAAKAQVDHILTLNTKDFQRVYPALAASVITP